MNFVGIDYSMTSPGWTVINGERITSYFLTTKSKMLGEIKISDSFSIVGIEYPDYKSDVERFNKLAKLTLSCMPLAAETKIAIEGYSFGSTGARIFQIGENGGVVKNLLWENGYDVIAPAPTEIKKFASGKGNSRKDQMFDAFIKQTGFDESYLRQTFNMQGEIKSPLADIVDSYFLAMYVKSHS